MSRSKNTGKRLKPPRSTPEFPDAWWPVRNAVVWGSTQRIRRKHRKMWGRRLSKLRRNEDKNLIGL